MKITELDIICTDDTAYKAVIFRLNDIGTKVYFPLLNMPSLLLLFVILLSHKQFKAKCPKDILYTFNMLSMGEKL